MTGMTGIASAPSGDRATARLVSLFAALITAGCGAAGTQGAANAPTVTATSTTTTSAESRRAAEAELENLMSRLRLPEGAQRLTVSPIAFLGHAPESIGSPDFLSATQWWTVDEPMASIESWIQAHPPLGLSHSGGGSYGGPMVPDNALLKYTDKSAETYASPGLLIEVADTGHATTDIRVDAEDVWLPARSPDEFIALGTHMTLLADKDFYAKGQPPLFTKLLNAADGDALIADLNALPTNDGGVRGCGFDQGYRVIAIAIVAGVPEMFDDWTACGEVLVSRGGKSLTPLDTSPALNAEVLKLAGPPPAIS